MKVLPQIKRIPFGDTIVELGEVGPPDDDGMLNANQAAEFLGVSVHKVSRLVRDGALPAYRWSVDRRHRLFDRRDLKTLLPRAKDLGNDWSEPTPDDRAALEHIHERIAAHGATPGPNGYDLQRLIDIVEEHDWAWSLEKKSGPWRFEQDQPVVYFAEVNRRYRPGLGGFSVSSHGWSPAVALARSLDQLLQDEATGASRLF